jgi:hypothetical protein
MDMQDKEFDEVFNSKFEDLEVEPSPIVWDKIDVELGNKKAKIAIMPWLSIAATILVVFATGGLFLQKGTSTDKTTKPNKLASDQVKQAVPTKIDEPVKKEDKTIAIEKSIENIASNKVHQPKNILPVNKVVGPVVQPVVNAPVQTQTVNPDDKQLIAAVPDPASTHVITTVPDNNVQLSLKSSDVVAHTPIERPTVMASTNDQEAAPVKKRGIHSFGGLINVLVAKIDKRQDKIIEFTDSDDDDAESNITGVNLGLVKIKKQ